MICPKCGRQIPDGTVCPCSAPQPYPVPPFQRELFQRQMFRRELSSNPALNVLKNVGSSPVFLAAAICLSLFLVFFWITFGGFLGFMDAAYANAPDIQWPSGVTPPTGWEDAHRTAGEQLKVVMAVYLAAASLPVTLSLVGVWLHYGTCRSRKSGGISTVGLTLLKIRGIINLSLICLVAVLFLGVILVGLIAIGVMSSQTEIPSDFPVALFFILYGILFVVFGAMFAVAILYYVFLLKTVNRAKAVARSGQPDRRVPMYLTVFNYMKAGYLGLYAMMFLPFSLIPVSELSHGEAPDMHFVLFVCLAMAVQAAYWVLMNIAMGRYRQGMTQLMVPYGAVPAPAVPVQPLVQSVVPVAPQAPAPDDKPQ